MSERLTRERLQNAFFWSAAGMDQLWGHIESDREAIREETRAELLKDHFKIGEVVEANTGLGWQRRTVVLVKDPTGNWDVASEAVRRPPKKRPMTREEMERVLWTSRQSDEDLRAMLHAIGATSEIQE